MHSENQIAAGIIVNESGEILLQLRDDNKTIRSPGMWSFPGGHVNLNESIEKALFREILEETALEFDNAIFICSINDFSEGTNPYKLHFWYLEYQADQEYICQEGVMLKFWPINEIMELNTPSYIDNVLNIFKATIKYIP